MKMFEVFSASVESYGGMLALDPPEPQIDFTVVEAASKREAIKLAVGKWLQDNRSVTRALRGEKNPYAGVTAHEIPYTEDDTE